MDLLGKVLKKEGGVSKVETDLKKILPVMVAAWLCDPVVHKQPKGIFLSKTGRQAGREQASIRLWAYHSSGFCFASNEIRILRRNDKRAKGKNVYSMYGEMSFQVFRDKLIPQIVFSSLDR